MSQKLVCFFLYIFVVQTVHIKIIEKKKKKNIWSFDLDETSLKLVWEKKNNKHYFAKHFSESNDRKWVKIAFENLNISFIPFTRLFSLLVFVPLFFLFYSG